MIINKVVSVFIALIIFAVSLVVLPYAFTFGENLSFENQDWGSFGAYVGGLLSPIIAALALFGLGFTIRQQNQELLELKNQFAVTQIESTITRIERYFIECLKEQNLEIKLEVGKQNYTCYDVLMVLLFPEWEKVIPPMNGLNRSKEYGLFDSEIKLYEVFGSAAGHLNQLRLYVNKHAEVSKTNILSKYYARKYRIAYQRLETQGYWAGKENAWICD